MWHRYFANLFFTKYHARKSVFAPKTLMMQDGFWYLKEGVSSTKKQETDRQCNSLFYQSVMDHPLFVPPVSNSYSC